MNKTRLYLYLLLLPETALLAAFLAWPLLLVLWESFFVEGNLSHANYSSLFVKNLYRESFFTSLALSVSTAFLGTLLGLPVSYAIHRSGRYKSFLMALTSVPLTFSGLVVGFAFIVLLGTSGFFTLLLKRFVDINPLEFSAFLFTWRGLVVAYLYFLVPRMILTMTVAWSNADWSLIEAATSLGAGRRVILFRVLLPMLGPAILSGSSLLFAVSMGAFGTAFALTGTAVKILPMVIYTQVSDMSSDIAQADALAIILTVTTTLVIMIYERTFREKRSPFP
ncbi:MAG: ABC transporter permease subunit [Synergistaceae bacterium]|nr:ABC transporter permease subunit [Synergistaceae bacterium]